MNQLQEEIYSNDYTELIIPYDYTNPEGFLEMAAPYNPQIINDLYGVVHIRSSEFSPDDPTTFLYSLVPNLFVPLDTTSLEVSGILRVQTQPALQLKGENVLIGFIDTGINYTHPAFLAPGNRTRILRIWDQTIPSEDNSGPFGYGTEYTDAQINDALENDDPASLLPSKDTNGHGTFIAGTAAGSADPVSDFTGVAPLSKIAVVRLKEAKQPLKDFYYFSGSGPVYQETDLMTGIQYLISLSTLYTLPLVICIALGSNQGDHMGYTPLELSIRQFEIRPGYATVAAGGNEAGKAHHYFGSVPSSLEGKNVEVFVRDDTAGFSLELWGNPPDLFSVGFRSPGGEIIPRIPTRLGRTEVVRFFLENTVVYIN
ncbi:MAG: protease, partial [Clostridia bacterium]|nr:protease [Clostridia bacterium]